MQVAERVAEAVAAIDEYKAAVAQKEFVLAELLATIEKRVKDWQEKAYAGHKDYLKLVAGAKLKFEFNKLPGDVKWTVQLHLVGHGVDYKVFAFQIQNFPSCCSMQILHAFSTPDEKFVKQPEFEFLLDCVFKNRQMHDVGVALGMWYGSRRLMCAMVNRDIELDAETQEDRRVNAQQVFKAGITKRLDYQWYYDWFKKQVKCEVVNSHYNANTGKTIHLIETVIDADSDE